jgi:HAE1 family hydrophobic/amphiphilic exporter-1
VVLENISRHIEEGMKPMAAALRGAREVGFTVLSMSLSLIAVFIPLLLMGGIVGRLFREFAVTVTLTIAVSVMVSLTLTPMLCSRFLKQHDPAHGASHGRLYQLFERGFDAMLGAYRRGLDHVLDHQFLTLCVFLLTVATTVVLFVIIPKGFFPQQDTGFLFGTAESAQDASFKSMNARMVALADIVRSDPDVAAVGSLTRRGLEAVVAGTMPGGTVVPGAPHGEALADALFALLAGETPEFDQLVNPSLVLTPEEAAEWLEKGGL